ncbi:23S rRNA methyltransferase attenuation leader peptide [Streptococcus suis]
MLVFQMRNVDKTSTVNRLH